MRHAGDPNYFVHYVVCMCVGVGGVVWALYALFNFSFGFLKLEDNLMLSTLCDISRKRGLQIKFDLRLCYNEDHTTFNPADRQV